MPEEQKQNKQENEVDDGGVPLSNRIKEMERKMQEKYGRELDENKRELAELKARLQEDDDSVQNPEKIARAALTEFVKDPDAYIRRKWAETEFTREIPQAESWLKSQAGYSADDDAAVFRIIKETKLDTPYHTPMERARTAWRLLSAEKREKQASAQTDDQKREAAAHTSAAEGTGKATPKTKTVTRNDVLRKLADAEAKGDLDAAIRHISTLEDIRE